MTLSDKRVKIRKKHRCFSCLRIFDPGVVMRYWTGICDGDFSSVYSCDTCDQIMILVKSDEDYFPEGYVFEMLERNQTPEELLITITTKPWPNRQ
jgi:hypothetical protein